MIRFHSPSRTHAHQLVHALDRERVGDGDLREEALRAVERARPLVVLGGLRLERLEVEVLGLGARGERHQRAAHDPRVAGDERGRAVAAQLARPVPLEQRGADRHDRQARHERQAAHAAQRTG